MNKISQLFTKPARIYTTKGKVFGKGVSWEGPVLTSEILSQTVLEPSPGTVLKAGCGVSRETQLLPYLLRGD